MKLTHAKLVELAAKWLRAKRFPVVITEIAGQREEPDALGFKGNSLTAIVECKAERGDFLSDKKKSFRRNPTAGMGDERYYMAPEGLIKPDELPAGWGLIEVNSRGKARLIVRPIRMKKNWRPEMGIMISLVRRIAQDAPVGVSCNTYLYETANRTTLGVKKDKEDTPDGTADRQHSA